MEFGSQPPPPMPRSRTQVGIVGAGPAGLLLGHLLHLNGIDSVIVENRSRDYVIDRVRAGVLEQGTVDLLQRDGRRRGPQRAGLRHDGLYISFQWTTTPHRSGRTDGRQGDHRLWAERSRPRSDRGARRRRARPLYFEADSVSVDALDSSSPVLRFRHDGADHEVRCDFIAGCDGFHGICRPSIPHGVLTIYERVYPFGWLGILAEAAPSSDELVYTLPRARLRAVQHALAEDHAPVSSGAAGRTDRALVGRRDLGRDARRA